MNVLSNKNESIHQFIIEDTYARLRAKQKANEAFVRSTEQQTATSKNPMYVTLEELYEEEAALLSEKDQLVRAKQELKRKITEQIDNSKSRIDQLEAEILEIRQECQTLAAPLGIPISK